MTGLEKIIDQIRQDAGETARHRTAEAEKEAEAILAAAREEAREQAAEYQRQAQNKKADLLSRAKSAAELESRKQLLSAKQRLIGQAVEAAKVKLDTLPDDAYFAALLKLAEKNATGEPGEMRLNQKDLARLPETFAAKLPKGITLSKEAAPIKNGFLLLYGGIDLNCTFDALFEAAAEALQDKAASILFG